MDFNDECRILDIEKQLSEIQENLADILTHLDLLQYLNNRVDFRDCWLDRFSLKPGIILKCDDIESFTINCNSINSTDDAIFRSITTDMISCNSLDCSQVINSSQIFLQGFDILQKIEESRTIFGEGFTVTPIDTGGEEICIDRNMIVDSEDIEGMILDIKDIDETLNRYTEANNEY